MKKSLFYLSLIFFSAAVFFTACKKSDNAKNLEQDVMTSEDLAESEDFDQQLDFDADIAIEERGGTATCPVVTMDQPYGTWPNTITVDAGAGIGVLIVTPTENGQTTELSLAPDPARRDSTDSRSSRSSTAVTRPLIDPNAVPVTPSPLPTTHP